MTNLRIALAVALCLAHCGCLAATSTDVAEVTVTGTPWTPTQYVASPTPCKGADGLELVDVDGVPSVVVPCEQSANIVVAARDGSGWYEAEDHLEGIEDVAVADLDADGEDDLVFALDNGTSFGALRGPAFTTRLVMRTGNHYMQVGVADVTGDGLPDVLAAARNVSSTNSASGYMRRNGGVDAWTAAGWTWVQGALSGWTMTMEPLDWDDDGDLDVFRLDRKGAANSNPEKGVWVDINNGSGGFTPNHLALVTGDPAAGDAADSNGDGLYDLFVAGNKTSIKVYTASGGTWTAGANIIPTGVGDLHALTLCDLGAGLQIVATFALADIGESWVAVGELDGSAWYEVAGAADVVRKPDVARCLDGKIWVPEGNGSAPQNDRGAEEWAP